jgi:hypothetical protein
MAPVLGVAIGAVLGLCLWIVIQVAYVGVNVWRYTLLARLERGEEIDPSLLDAHDAAYRAAEISQYVALVVAAVLFISWLFRVRTNAEASNDRPHQWGRAWLVFAWIIPIGNLWWPKQLVDDIWVVSDPGLLAGPPGRRSWLVRAWWAAWVLFVILDRLITRISDASAGADANRQAVTNAFMKAPLGITAAVLAVLVVGRLSGFQETRRRELAAIIG